MVAPAYNFKCLAIAQTRQEILVCHSLFVSKVLEFCLYPPKKGNNAHLSIRSCLYVHVRMINIHHETEKLTKLNLNNPLERDNKQSETIAFIYVLSYIVHNYTYY